MNRVGTSIAVAALALTACGRTRPPHVTPSKSVPAGTARIAIGDILPRPSTVEPRDGQFVVDATTALTADTSNPDVARVAAMLAQYIQRASGLRIQPAASPAAHAISVAVASGENPEAYELTIAADRVSLVGSGPAGLFYGFEAFFRRQLTLEDVRRVLDLSTSRTGEIAAEEYFEHYDERIPLTSSQLLLHDVCGDRPHLGNWHWH